MTKSYVQFQSAPVPGQKTGRWWVTSSTYLGVVKWHAHWRRYAFLPDYDTIFDAACLAEIERFIIDRMAERR